MVLQEPSAGLVWSRLNKLPAAATTRMNLDAPNCTQSAEALLPNCRTKKKKKKKNITIIYLRGGNESQEAAGGQRTGPGASRQAGKQAGKQGRL